MRLIKTLATASVLAFGAIAAHATTYQITNSIRDGGTNGFGSSGFHDQDWGQAGGDYFSLFDDATVTGAYDDTIGGSTNIYFAGDLTTGGGSFTAQGYLNQSADPLRPNGLFGDLVINIMGSAIAGLNGMFTFTFADVKHNAEANGRFNDTIALWGDNGLYGTQQEGLRIGLDVRLQLEEGGDFNIPPVPVPASALLLFGAIGGLGGLRKFRKKT